MTLTSTTFNSQTRLRFWAMVLGAIVALVVGAWLVMVVIRAEVRQLVSNSLEVISDSAQASLDEWLQSRQDLVGTLVERPLVREYARASLLGDEDIQKWFGDTVMAVGGSLDFVSFFLFDANDDVHLASVGPSTGRLPSLATYLTRCVDEGVIISPPIMMPHDAAQGEDVPHIAVCAAIRDTDGSLIGKLAMLLHPEDDFAGFLEELRFGESGETYLVNADGMMVSPSRFGDTLRKVQLLPEGKPNTILSLPMKDPGVCVISYPDPADRPRLANQPFTRAATELMAGQDGMSLDPYNDYRGQKVVGAWRWMPERNMGIITEVDGAEVERPWVVLRSVFLVTMGILAITVVGLLIYLQHSARLARRAAKAEGKVRALGQYRLVRKLGAGGMGEVYIGEHALMRRPTAIKLLQETTNRSDTARFEREVRLTCQLSHPNTIAIYDYGRTAEGVFYYAMELLDGMDLECLVEEHGPIPQERVVHLLIQACGSLGEAHEADLIHRDIKPANIFLTRRGGIHDFVKVLDFGLVKAMDSEATTQVTQENMITGTPAYLSPETANQNEIDHRSDLYSLGCVAYFLLTGTVIFDRPSVMNMIMAHVAETPEPMSQRGITVDADLEAVVMACLAKKPEDRPDSAADLAARLAACNCHGQWDEAQAAAWWDTHADESKRHTTRQDQSSMTLDLELNL